MDNKFQDVRATGVQGNDATQQSASFGYGQVIPAAPVLPATPPVQPAAAPAPPIPPVSPPPQPSVEPAITPTTPPTPPPAPRPRTPLPWKKILKYTAFVALGLLVLGGLWLAYNAFTSNKKEAGQVASRFDSVQIPLEDFINQDGLTLLGTRSLIVNGPLLANDGFTISPSTQPSNAQRGQIYFDANNNELAYFNGAQFVPVAGTTNIVRSISGFSGQVTLGQGLNGANGQISNSGVLSLQGQTGNVTLIGGAGIAVNGTTLSNTGVTSLGGTTGDITVGTGLTITPDKQLQNAGVVSATAGSGITVTNDGAGNITISNSGAGSGTVQSPGGTAGRIAKFTGVQTIEDSLLSESGATVTVNGSLSTTSNAAVGGSLTLGTALTVGNGGTGATSLANNGVLIGQGAGALTAVTAGGSGLCLMSTAGAPTFSACPGGGGGVTSLNGLTGALTVANASAGGSTITINDASTSQKGIAQFNSTNFSASSGTINTIQDIHVAATPTFGRLTVTSSQASNAMLLINNTNASASGNLLDIQLNGSSRLAVSPAGAMTLASTINGQTISSAANFTGTLDVAGQTTINGGANVTGTLSVNNIYPIGATLALGQGTKSYQLIGTGSSTIVAANGANLTTLTVDSPSGTGNNAVYHLQSAASGSYNICTSVGNCAGVGGGVTTAGGTTNRLAKFTGSQVIGDSIITDNGTTVTIAGTLAVNTITPAAAMTIGSTTQNLTLQGAVTSLSSTNSGVTNSLTFATPSGGNKTITLPNATGTVAVSASGPLAVDSNGNITCPTCVTSGGGGGGVAAVDSLNGLTGALTLANATGSGSTITINDASTSQKGIAQFNSTNFSASGGTINTIQNIDTTAAPTFARLSLTSSEASAAMLLVNNTNAGATGNLLDIQLNGSSRLALSPAGALTVASTINGQTISSAASFTGSLAVAGAANLNGGASVTGTLNANTITPTGALTVGATGQSFLLQGNASSSITATSGGSTTSLTFQTPTANVAYRLPTAAAGTYDICSTAGNCAGVGGGVTTAGGTVGTIAKFTAGQAIGDSLLSESGSVVTVNGNLNLTSGNQFRINGTQISSADLSNDANLAKLNASQTFTGNTLAFQNGTNSATAFSVQNAAGARAFTVDTSGAQVVLGQSSSLNGTLVFANSSNTNTTTLTAATPSASRSIVLPNESGTVCTTGSVCTGYAPGSGSGNYIHNTTTPQTANIAIRSANDADITVHIKQRPTQTADFIRVDDTNDVAVYNLDTFGNAHYAHKIDVAGAAAFGAAADTGIAVKVVTQADSQIGLQVSGINSGQTGDIMQLLGPGSRSLTYAANGTVALKGGTLQSTDLLQIQNSSGDVLSLFNASGQLTLGRIAASGTTQAGSLKFADGTNSNFSVTLGTTTLSANRTITLPNVSGTVCLDSGNCASTATLQTAYNNGNSITTTDNRNITFNLADTATDSNFLVNLQCTTTCSTNGRFAVQNSGTDVFAVSPNGGNVLFKNSTNAVTGFQIQNSSAGSVFNVDTSNNRVGINNSAPAADFDVGPTGLAIGQIVQGRFGDLILQSQEAGANGITASTNRGSNGNLTLDGASGSSLFLSPFTTNNNYLAAGGGKVRVGNSSAPVYTLDVTGDTNTSGAYRIGGVTICTSSGCTASAASAIQNQNAAQQTSANFWISGTGRADTALQAPLFDRATAGALAIGTTNATSIAMQQDTTFASGKTLTLQGAFAMQPALDSTSALNVKTSLGNNIFTIDTTNGRVGIGLSASNLPTLANEGLEIRGALRLSGSADSISDLYTTPLGNTVDTMINILNYDPGGSGQLIAMGLPSTANSTSRAITLLDARAGAHQPTLAVLSPNENQIGGFSWDGSNTDFFIKNSEAAGKIASNIGGTNRLVVTNAGIGVNMTPVDAAVDVTTASTSQVGLKVTGVSGQTADVLQLDVTGVGRVVSVNNGGASTFQNYSNSTTAFRVLNSASVPQFVVDASNSRMYIGNPTGDTTGALLVLDTKTSAGDPTGVNGGMYYNSSLGKMRCYENSAWNDCISTTRTSYRYDNDFITTAGDSVISIQDSGAGASHTNIASIAGHQGIIRLATGTTTTGWSNVGTNDPGQAYYFGSENIQLETVVRINNLSDGTETFTSRIGFADSVTTDGTDGCFFRYTHSVQSGNWQGVCVKAGVTTTCNTTVAVAAGSWYRLTVNVNAAATAAVFTVNGTTSCTVASGIPSGAGEESSLNINLVKSAGTTSRTMDVDYMEIQTQYPASR